MSRFHALPGYARADLPRATGTASKFLWRYSMAGASLRPGLPSFGHSRVRLASCWLGLLLVVSGAAAGCEPGEVDLAACPGSTNWDQAASVEGEDTTIRGPVEGVSYRP